MYKNIIVIPFLLICLLVGCESATESYSTIAEDYYPLKIGNKWYYKSNPTDSVKYNETIEIVGTKIINNKSYYVREYKLPPSTYSDTSYVRTENSKLFFARYYYYNYQPSFRESLGADFYLQVGDTVWENRYRFLTVIERSQNIIKFYSLGDLRNEITYQKGIGVIRNFRSNHNVNLSILVKAELK